MNRGMPAPRKRREVPAFAEADTEGDNLSVDGIEVVQVIQDMDHSVALIAGKRTIVRVYLSRPAGTTVVVRGEIAVRRTVHGAVQNVPSLDTVRVRPAQNDDLQKKREDLKLSLNFRLPDSLTTADRIIINVASLTNTATGASVPCTNCNAKQVEVRFKEAAPLRVRLIKIRYRTPTNPNGYVPTSRDAALFKSWLNRAYPTNQVIFSQTTVESPITPPFDEDEDEDTSNVVNAQLSAVRNLDIDGGTDQRTHYYGMVSDEGGFMRGSANDIPGIADPTAVASGPTGQTGSEFGYVWDSDGSYGDWYGAHELAHTFGRLHPGFCNGNTGDDDNYPFPDGQLSTDDGAFVGLDTGDSALGVPMKALPGQRWHDVMTYCARQWISSYTFEGIRRRLAREDLLGPSPGGVEDDATAAAADELEVSMASGSFVNVVATINLTKRTSKILYVNPVSRVLTPAPAGDTRVEVRILDDQDQPLETLRVAVKLNTCSDSKTAQIGVVDAVIPWHPNARQLQLLIDGQVVDTYRGGAITPNVSNLHHEGTSDSDLSFAWEAADDPGATNIKYNVQSSTDDGQTWQTVAVGHTSPQVDIDRSQYPPGSRVTVRVIATDGFTNTVISTDTFAVDEPTE